MPENVRIDEKTDESFNKHKTLIELLNIDPMSWLENGRTHSTVHSAYTFSSFLILATTTTTKLLENMKNDHLNSQQMHSYTHTHIYEPRLRTKSS